LAEYTGVVYPEDGAEERDWDKLELSVVKGEEMDVELLITLVVELE
jgi:hypothetical protein